MNDSLFMGSTKIGTTQTLGQITGLLSRYGATAILTEYKDQEIAALSFRVPVNGQEIPFRLPCRWEPVFKQINTSRRRFRAEKEEEDKAQAKRVAWRQILRWIEAQMALVQTNMVSVEEVFMPYIQVRGGKTLFEIMQKNNFKMLEGPKS